MKPLSREEWEKIKEKENLLNEVVKILKVSGNQITDKIKKLISENKELKREIEELSRKDNSN